MKQLINIGGVVDDGQGDYLRRGGQKTNSNFEELYHHLGDGMTPHSAGAWKSNDGGDTATIAANFGESIAVNTTKSTVIVRLPKGNVTDYNKVVRLRDVWNSWFTNPVQLFPADGDTIKGHPSVRLDKNFMDVELVYCAPGRWEYVANKQVDKITTSDLSTVAKKEFIATQDQTDFVDIFTPNVYNINNIEVYLRGNLLYYGEQLSDDSNYGSIDPTNPENVLPLDGNTIRLKIKCNAGDTVTIVTYMDGIASWRSTYTRKQLRMYDSSLTMLESVTGERIVDDLATKKTFTIQDLGLITTESINPNSLEVLINGIELIRAGYADQPLFVCEEDPSMSEEDCQTNGYNWTNSNSQYDIEIDSTTNKVASITFARSLEHDDVLTLKWYNNDIGTLLEWEGEGGIKQKTDLIYLNNEQEVELTNTIFYEDMNNPSQQNMTVLPDIPAARIEDISSFFDLIYPIGTLYYNAHNPANPRDYMGFGTWTRYSEAEGRAIVGWNSDNTDSVFGLNNNDLDSNNQPKHSAGGTVGERSTTLLTNNLPEVTTDEKVLVADDEGMVVIGGCQYDPDQEGPGYSKYREDNAYINKDTGGIPINNIQPSVTVHVWIRVA